MALFLSDILGGPEQSVGVLPRQLAEICRTKELLQPKLLEPTDFAVNVVFHYPGSIYNPDFSGIEIGGLSRKTRVLEIRVAVASVSLTSGDFLREYFDLLRHALVEGKKHLDNKRLPFCLEDHLALVDAMMARLSLT